VLQSAGLSTASHMTVSRLLDRSAQLWPDKIAIVVGDTQLTYAALQAMSCRFARYLQSIGVTKGHRVAVIFPNSAQYVACFFAIARIGAVLVPLNPAYTDDELVSILGDASVVDVFCVPTHRDRLEALRPKLPDLGRVTPVADLDQFHALSSGHSDDWYEVPIDEATTHAIMFTSGTTGRVKGAILSHRTRVVNSLAGQIGYEITAQTRANVPAPMFHSGGMILGLINVLAAGGTLLIPRDGSVDAAVDAFVRQGANLLLTVPTLVFRMVDHPVFSRTARDLPFSIIHGAAPMPGPVVDRLLGEFPKCRPFHGYGSTEACQLTVLGPNEYRRFPTATGRALPGVDVRVVDEQGCAVAPGVVGEIVTAGSHVFDGYLNAPQQTAEALHDGLHWTGDLATIDERGIITVVGRRKDMIISGGFNIYAREVEDVLQRHPAVQEAAVFGIPDIEWGESVAAAVIVTPGMHLNADDVVAHCRDHLASYKKPKYVYFVPEFPRNTIGKILKSTLAQALSPRSPR
jgi:acyl-CoA synthetase (AMP-forming)/AMP-acid ligase II